MNKKLNKIDVFSIVLGSIIGWGGSFMLPGTKFLNEAGVINTTIGLFFRSLIYNNHTKFLLCNVRKSQ